MREKISGAASRSSFIEHCYREALALFDEDTPVGLALAQALIDHPERTLSAEIDAVIAQTLAKQALTAEQGRRAAWRGSSPSALRRPPRKRDHATWMHVAQREV
jgi:hypothetical protein